MLVRKYADENGSTAMLIIKRSAGVALEVNLRIPLCTGNEARKQEDPPRLLNSGPKQGYQWPHKKDWYPPIFTGRNEVVAKVIFLHLSVIHSVHRGGEGLPQCMLGYHPPPDQTPPPWIRHPPGIRHPPRIRHHPPRDQTPPPSGPGRHPPGPGRHAPPREADSSIRSTSGRYASYWNAFFFFKKNLILELERIKDTMRRFWQTAEELRATPPRAVIH